MESFSGLFLGSVFPIDALLPVHAPPLCRTFSIKFFPTFLDPKISSDHCLQSYDTPSIGRSGKPSCYSNESLPARAKNLVPGWLPPYAQTYSACYPCSQFTQKHPGGPVGTRGRGARSAAPFPTHRPFQSSLNQSPRHRCLFRGNPQNSLNIIVTSIVGKIESTHPLFSHREGRHAVTTLSSGPAISPSPTCLSIPATAIVHWPYFNH